ncbi:FG-GAP repeat protein, partial [Streptomyces spectabilis]|uniref:FG-GAP repeat protein n=1 Tax=Streptomyces spectabilis TaxID=68270 RepID=UPI00340E6309
MGDHRPGDTGRHRLALTARREPGTNHRRTPYNRLRPSTVTPDDPASRRPSEASVPQSRRILTYAIAAAAAATAGIVLPPGAAAAAPPAATSDFNGDGYADLAVGVPDGTV